MMAPQVALIGANSRIGSDILSSLLNDSPSKLQITVFLRPTSRPVPPHPQVRQVTIPSDPPTLSDLIHALQDIEVLICALNPSELELQLKLADAACEAGVERFIPADYGSMRSDDPYVLDLLPNFRNKQRIRQHCQRLSEDYKEFSWTSIVTGHFFDYGLQSELLGLNLEKGEILMFDHGEDKFSTTTRKQIGKAVVGVLEDLEGTKNEMLLIESFCVTQKEVLEVVEKVRKELGEKKKIERIEIDSKKFVKDRREGAGKVEPVATEEMVAVLGIKRSKWEKENDNKLLGLKDEDMESIVREVLKEEMR